MKLLMTCSSVDMEKKGCFLMNLKYFRYLLVHKWFVLLQCCKQGIWWRGFIHDWHKFLPSEWSPYVNYFYGTKDEAAFDFAWLLHQKRADHHWQWWLLPLDDGGVKILPMSHNARLEMLCDWWGIGAALRGDGWPGVERWYQDNKLKMRLHPETREWVEKFLKERVERFFLEKAP